MTNDSVIDKIKDTVLSSIRQLGENVGVQSAVFSSSEMGPIVHSLLGVLNTGYLLMRWQNLVSIMNSEMKMLDEIKIDWPYLESEEYIDLIRRIVEQSAKTRYHERVKLFCQILRSAISVDGKKYRQYSEDFLYIVSDLSPTDMAVAAQIFLQQEHMLTDYPRGNPKINELANVKKRGWITIRETCNLNEVSFQLSLVKLAKSSLIRELVGYLDNTGQGIYVITTIFREFAKHIRTTSNQPIMGFDQSNAKD